MDRRISTQMPVTLVRRGFVGMIKAMQPLTSSA